MYLGLCTLIMRCGGLIRIDFMLKDVYDKVYSSNSDYNFHYPPKDILVDIYAQNVGGKILDAGCGQGIHLKRLLKNGIDAFGIEMSEVCCQKYLSGSPHENVDICSYKPRDGFKFDGIVCMDVLEHVPVDTLAETIEALESLAPSALLGIANHSDIQCGEELHLIQEGIDWWKNKLSSCYSVVYPVATYFGGEFFFIEVSNISTLDQLINKWCRRNGSVVQLAKAFDDNRQDGQNFIEQHKLLQSEYQSLLNEHQELSSKYHSLLSSKPVRIINKIKSIIGKPVSE